MKLLVLLGSAPRRHRARSTTPSTASRRFEFPVLLLFATVGMMMMISANDLITLYLGLELQSLALYVLAAFARDDLRSTEAGLKYFVLGALASGLLLYGALAGLRLRRHHGFRAPGLAARRSRAAPRRA